MTGRREGFLRSGHFPTLIAALLYFDVSFMAWVLLGPLAPFLREELGLSATQQGLLVAIPLLGGSLFRPVLGVLGDWIGGRRTGLIGLALTLVPLVIAWKWASTPVLQVGSQWSARWHQDAVKQSGIFCYRGVVRRLRGAETA